MSSRFKNITNQRFGRLVAIKPIKIKNGRYHWLFKCDCGKEKIINISSVLKGATRSCGCLAKETSPLNAKKGAKKIAEKIRKYTVEQKKIKNIYNLMKFRCYNSKSNGFKNYGGRGISICNEWLNNYESFEKWAFSNGYKYGLSIDRIDNNGNYCPENCRWATKKEQARNRRTNVFYMLNGKKTHLIDVLNETGYWVGTYRSHLSKNKTKIEDIFKGIDFKKFKIERCNK